MLKNAWTWYVRKDCYKYITAYFWSFDHWSAHSDNNHATALHSMISYFSGDILWAEIKYPLCMSFVAPHFLHSDKSWKMWEVVDFHKLVDITYSYRISAGTSLCHMLLARGVAQRFCCCLLVFELLSWIFARLWNTWTYICLQQNPHNMEMGLQYGCLCPAFTDTPIIQFDEKKVDYLEEAIPIMETTGINT